MKSKSPLIAYASPSGRISFHRKPQPACNWAIVPEFATRENYRASIECLADLDPASGTYFVPRMSSVYADSTKEKLFQDFTNNVRLACLFIPPKKNTK